MLMIFLEAIMILRLIKEETILFPAFSSGVNTERTIGELDMEHFGAGDAQELLRKI